MSNKSFIELRIENLKKEAKLLDEKISKVRDRGDYGTYKNLIQVYSEILRLIERYDWVQKYGEYNTDGKKQVAIWEQSSDGIIRNHKIWDVNDAYKDAYIDVAIENDKVTITLYEHGAVTYMTCKTIKDAVDRMGFVFRDKNIYLDIRGIGKAFADELDTRGIKYNKLLINRLG